MSNCAISGRTPQAVNFDSCAGGQTPVAGPPGGSLLPPPMAQLANSGDLGAQIAALLLEAGYEQKKSGRETRAVAEKAQAAADNAQLDAMEREAGKKLVAGIISGGTTVISGGLQFTAGAIKANENKSNMLLGAGKGVEGLGKIGATIFEHDAEMASKDAKAAEQASDRQKRGIEDARDTVKEAKELINRALDYYKEYLTAKNDSMKASLLRA